MLRFFQKLVIGDPQATARVLCHSNSTRPAVKRATVDSRITGVRRSDVLNLDADRDTRPEIAVPQRKVAGVYKVNADIRRDNIKSVERTVAVVAGCRVNFNVSAGRPGNAGV